MSFSELGLDPLILKSVLAAGYENATPVQMQAIPAALTGRDLLVSSNTGSGKTAAFLLPSIQRLQAEPTIKSMGPRVLVLTPTRELALQVEKSAMKYGNDLRRFRTACLVGGAPYGLQLKRLSQPVDVVVATPGRLIDHLERGKIDFSRLEVLVLDEADRMLDMGFVDDIKAIAARCPSERQTLLFSATLDGVVGNLARELTRDAQRIEIEAVPKQEAKIEQRLLFADNMDHKNRLLDALLRDVEMVQAIVFASTKRRAPKKFPICCPIAALLPTRCMATCSRVSATARCNACAKAAPRCWSPPTLPHAASTWRASATSSTLTCRARPKTTCTASAAPAVLAAPASR